MLHKNIKFLRQQSGLSQTRYGAALGITRGMVDSYERKLASPDTETIAKIAIHHNVSIDDLLTKDFTANPSILYTTNREQKTPLVEAKDELIKELREQVSFLRNQNLELSKKLNNNG